MEEAIAVELTDRPKYPGLGLPLRQMPEGESYAMGASIKCDGAISMMVSVRELAMMVIMDQLSDKVDWHKKVFDEKIVYEWQTEAIAVPDIHWERLAMGGENVYSRNDEDDSATPELKGIIDRETFETIIKELQNKANHFKKTGIIPTLDASSSIAKSDVLVSFQLRESLRVAFQEIKDDRAERRDWYPHMNEIVQNLVDPSMYPLVYGRSRVVKEELVGVGDAIGRWAGKGFLLEKSRSRFETSIPEDLWSDTYQWLPANVAFQKDGTVRFTSYINNLHPVKFDDTYRTMEELVRICLPMWDQCLAIAYDSYDTTAAGRTETRMAYPEDADEEVKKNWIPSDPQECANIPVNWDEHEDHDYDPEWDDEAEKKWELLRKPRIPEVPFEDISYIQEEDQKLANVFNDSGLQIIVKMTSIELTPEKPNFTGSNWLVEGQMNEHIVGTALYYLDIENVTDSQVSFRMSTDSYINEDIDVGKGCYHWLQKIYGTTLYDGSLALQHYGDVQIRPGRLLAFPNNFHHAVSPFSLTDKTKPGHMRYIALWLVDPNQRIISTANVPPQQQDWWIEATLGRNETTRSKAISKMPGEVVELMKDRLAGIDVTAAQPMRLPQELQNMVHEHFCAGDHTSPMTAEEATEHRLKLKEEQDCSAQVRLDEFERDWLLSDQSAFCTLWFDVGFREYKFEYLSLSW
ncbi:unnamed protein product [Periconia digitata]|uniref:Uncharacterized protein n=1 Tax=Periconia digitata TaxID=1303443 RepID=A0A9W4XRD4_9PLEO|nr:unnamed protein product [Periconia digitata]